MTVKMKTCDLPPIRPRRSMIVSPWHTTTNVILVPAKSRRFRIKPSPNLQTCMVDGSLPDGSTLERNAIGRRITNNAMRSGKH